MGIRFKEQIASSQIALLAMTKNLKVTAKLAYSAGGAIVCKGLTSIIHSHGHQNHHRLPARSVLAQG